MTSLTLLRRLGAALLLLLALPAFGATIYWDFHDATDSALANRKFYIFPAQLRTNGTAIITGDRIEARTEADSKATNSLIGSVEGAGYWFEFTGKWTNSSGYIIVGTNTSYNASDIWTNTLPASETATAFSKAEANARFYLNSNPSNFVTATSVNASNAANNAAWAAADHTDRVNTTNQLATKLPTTNGTAINLTIYDENNSPIVASRQLWNDSDTPTLDFNNMQLLYTGQPVARWGGSGLLLYSAGTTPTNAATYGQVLGVSNAAVAAVADEAVARAAGDAATSNAIPFTATINHDLSKTLGVTHRNPNSRQFTFPSTNSALFHSGVYLRRGTTNFFYIATRNTTAGYPSELWRMSDDFAVTNLVTDADGWRPAASEMRYSPEKDRIYTLHGGVSGVDAAYSGWITELHPDTLAATTRVTELGTNFGSIASFVVLTNEMVVFGGGSKGYVSHYSLDTFALTYRTNLGINDFTVTNGSTPHACVFDGTNVYVTGYISTNNTWVAAYNPTTREIRKSHIPNGSFSFGLLTDDMAEAGDYVWVGAEVNDGAGRLAAIRKSDVGSATVSPEYVATGVAGLCYGVFWYRGAIWAVFYQDNAGQIVEVDPNTREFRVYPSPVFQPNELIFDGNRFLVTEWWGFYSTNTSVQLFAPESLRALYTGQAHTNGTWTMTSSNGVPVVSTNQLDTTSFGLLTRDVVTNNQRTVTVGGLANTGYTNSLIVTHAGTSGANLRYTRVDSRLYTSGTYSVSNLLSSGEHWVIMQFGSVRYSNSTLESSSPWSVGSGSAPGPISYIDVSRVTVGTNTIYGAQTFRGPVTVSNTVSVTGNLSIESPLNSLNGQLTVGGYPIFGTLNSGVTNMAYLHGTNWIIVNGARVQPVTFDLTAATNGMGVGEFRIMNSNGLALISVMVSNGPAVHIKNLMP
jgi:hypothetical protein